MYTQHYFDDNDAPLKERTSTTTYRMLPLLLLVATRHGASAGCAVGKFSQSGACAECSTGKTTACAPSKSQRLPYAYGKR